jgi:protein-tyrosine phosphatase
MLFHCTQGKDRTGIAAMLILLLLGVDEETILDDFELTNKYRKSLIKEQMSNFRILSRLSKNIRTFLWVKEGVCRSFAAYALTTIQKRYPSYEDFFRTEYDLSEADIAKIRDMYLE